MPSWRRTLIVPVVTCVIVTGLAIAEPATAQVRASAGCFPAGGQVVPDAAAPSQSGIIVRGHGWGHSLGMSQYGAQGAARLGCTHAQILGTYYAGTHLRRQSMSAPVVLSLAAKASRATVGAENGKVTWSSPAGTVRVQPAGQTWTVAAQTRSGRRGIALLSAAGKTQIWITSGTLAAAHAGTTIRARAYTSGSSLAVDKRLRWGSAGFTVGSGITVEETIRSDGRGSAVDKYLWGLGEVPVSWPAEALRSQADAARTYLSGTLRSGAYRIGTTTAAQVYTGATREDEDARYGSAWRAAVNATSGELIVDGHGSPITAMYSSSDGGHSEDRAYVYGDQGGYGYLTGVDDSRWDLASSNPYRSWAKAFTPEEFAAALGFGSVSAVSLGAPGTAGRDAGLKVTGVIKGVGRTVAFTGSALRSALGLRSAAITVSWVQPAPVVPVDPVAPAVQPLAGDWNGDGRDEFGVYRSGRVTLRLADGSLVSYPLGLPGDRAVVGDWDGDGKDSVGVFRAGTWYLRNAVTAGPYDLAVAFGQPGDLPVTGQWAGPRRQGLGVLRGSTWYLRSTVTAGPADHTFSFGRAGDRPVAGDWDGDGADTPGLYRAGTWYLLPGLGGGTSRTVRFGAGTDLPVVADLDGDGTDATAVFTGQAFTSRSDLLGGDPTATFPLTW